MNAVLKRKLSVISGIVLVVYLFIAAFFAFPNREGGMTIENGKSAFVSATIESSMSQLNCWQPDDILFPRFVIDDVPNYQEGFWAIIRHNSRLLRDNLSRNRTSDGENEKLIHAYNLAAIDTTAFMFPSSKLSYYEFVDELTKYNDELVTGESMFHARAESLIQLIEQYASAMGGIYTKLNNSTAYEWKIIDGSNQKVRVVPWTEVDDNFFFAQGAALALYWSFKGIRHDYDSILKDKNSTDLCDMIIGILEQCQIPVIIVTNGETHSLIPLANKSMQLSAYIQDARQKMNSLISTLKDG